MKAPELAPKTRPSQTRAHDTFELIVTTAGRLLETIGFERLTTNLVCKEAGITPPALYRYFPNKYALVKELGDRLMAAQDAVAFDWLDRGAFKGETLEERVALSVEIHLKVLEVTRAFPGNIAIMRALRAIPELKEVRINSRNLVAHRQALALARTYPDIPPSTLLTCSKMGIEMLYAAMELVLEEPSDESLAIIEGACRAVSLYMDDLQARFAA
ncbi:TetR/AcrR family transcriptional regulator [Novosphingobium sp. 1949]|uniref:TetR/AcrR family transcriptional regulator n=1 Tax=Novosphingobium organovorum TaxID=2930092 RepID=A0ABT0BJ60_9SPHN|nr:TetR/AcrR family transcriptional regulator [Novosphingobium organovorum]MCJ2185075.1 TetR/AcrR family transcriptional regulator [Novosphingobium organovorum]